MCADTRDYKDTLFLPETDFPMRAGLPQREPDGSPAGSRSTSTTACARPRRAAPPFVLHDGPPYANGDIHIGHALNKILKDFVVRSPADAGQRRRYVPGWDCHGLPIEWKIEEQYRAKGQEQGRGRRRSSSADAATSPSTGSTSSARSSSASASPATGTTPTRPWTSTPRRRSPTSS